jgi:hypothetical protein
VSGDACEPHDLYHQCDGKFDYDPDCTPCQVSYHEPPHVYPKEETVGCRCPKNCKHDGKPQLVLIDPDMYERLREVVYSVGRARMHQLVDMIADKNGVDVEG